MVESPKTPSTKFREVELDVEPFVVVDKRNKPMPSFFLDAPLRRPPLAPSAARAGLVFLREGVPD